MGRHRIETAAVLEVPAVNETQLRADVAQLDEERRLVSQHDAAVRAVAAQVGYQLPGDCADPDLIQRDISANMRRSVEACLEVGRGLAVLRQACPHGEFMARLDVLGIEARVAQRFMCSARKFSNAASTPLLKAVGNQTKLFEMLVLDDEEIEELALTGQTGELKLDDVATMSVKELRAKLREAREDKKATESLLASKDAKINELAVADAKAKPVTKPWGPLVKNLRAEISAHFDLLDESATRLMAVHDAVLQGDFGEAEDPEGAAKVRRGLATLYGDRLARTFQSLGEVRYAYDRMLGGYAEEMESYEIHAPTGSEG